MSMVQCSHLSDLSAFKYCYRLYANTNYFILVFYTCFQFLNLSLKRQNMYPVVSVGMLFTCSTFCSTDTISYEEKVCFPINVHGFAENKK